MAFKGLTGTDFDAYEQRKWSSNRFNLERMRVREKVEELVRSVFEGLGDEATGLGMRSTQDHPTIFNAKKVDAQWVLLGRDEVEAKRIDVLATRERIRAGMGGDLATQHSELALSFRIDQGGIEIALRLHRAAALDRANLRQRLREDRDRAAFVGLLAALPGETVATVGRRTGPLESLVSDGLLPWVAALGDDSEWLMVGTAMGRRDPRLAGSDLVDVASSVVRGLLPLYRFACWTPENDRLDGVAFLEAEAERARSTAAVEPEVREEAPSPRRPDGPRTSALRGGWSYRPGWDYEAPPAAVEPAARSAPAFVRERAAETVAATRDWDYSGPVREPPRQQSAQDEARERRDDDGRGRGGRPGQGRDREHGDERRGSGGPPRGRPDRGDGRRGRPGGGRPRDDSWDERGFGRGGGRGREKGPIEIGGERRAASWADSPEEVAIHDHVRVTDGLLRGKVGKVVDITGKGSLKVAMGDMVFEVPHGQAVKVVAES